MTYLLSWRDYQAYLGKRDHLAAGKVGDPADGESLARIYVWKRFRRCHAPLLGRSLFPKKHTCDPQPYNDESHWDAQFRQWSNLRTRDARDQMGVDTTLVLPDFHDRDAAPPRPVQATGPTPVEEAEGAVMYDDLRRSIIEDFNTDVTYGPEIQQAMIEATYNVEQGDQGAFIDLVKDDLKARLPDSFDSGTDDDRRRAKERQALGRAAHRAQDHVAQWMEDR